jgi:hypothetical protein
MKHVTGENRFRRLIVALSLATFAGLLIGQFAWADHAAGHADSATLAANPELSAALLYTAVRSESAYLAANPELSFLTATPLPRATRLLQPAHKVWMWRHSATAIMGPFWLSRATRLLQREVARRRSTGINHAH